MTGACLQQPAGPPGDLGQKLVDLPRACDHLGELGDRLELTDARSRLVVEPCILDRARNQRGARDDELDL